MDQEERRQGLLELLCSIRAAAGSDAEFLRLNAEALGQRPPRRGRPRGKPFLGLDAELLGLAYKIWREAQPKAMSRSQAIRMAVDRHDATGRRAEKRSIVTRVLGRMNERTGNSSLELTKWCWTDAERSVSQNNSA